MRSLTLKVYTLFHLQSKEMVLLPVKANILNGCILETLASAKKQFDGRKRVSVFKRGLSQNPLAGNPTAASSPCIQEVGSQLMSALGQKAHDW